MKYIYRLIIIFSIITALYTKDIKNNEPLKTTNTRYKLNKKSSVSKSIYSKINKEKNYITIKQIKKYNYLTIEVNAADLSINMSGFIFRKVDNIYYKAYLVRVKNIDREKNIAYLSYEKLKSNKYNRYLPTINTKLNKNDYIIKMGYLYNRGVVIAPNKNAYIAFTNENNNVNWIEPDRLLFYLAYEKTYRLNNSLFNTFCKNNNLNLISVIIEHNVYTIDCNNFKFLSITYIDYPSDNRYIIPFYNAQSNILNGKIHLNTGFFGNNDISNGYNYFYKNFLGIR